VYRMYSPAIWADRCYVANERMLHPPPVAPGNTASMGAQRRHHRDLHPGTTLRGVHWEQETDIVRRLFKDYRAWLADHVEPTSPSVPKAAVGLAIVDKLISELPGAYGPPRGDVILAFVGNEVVACGALRELAPKIGEIKRVYVRADHRGPGFGPRLTQAVLDRAKELGYARVRVDTLASMTAAIEFYQEMGFVPTPAFWPHPVPGALFCEFALE
jgi:putative acetyltransferase